MKAIHGYVLSAVKLEPIQIPEPEKKKKVRREKPY